ncbi:putative cell wall-binding protein [Microbacteriaceae bacterium SG_E_30_P1]|uniref:Cell wall-binding protein n=1 Tax=Antiquaquibacter oligotrophicus TaxID=2880260 RepID=A0ABT6KJQ6_9MICO|nr:cell wall-binding repeat-containing protein [Antiquaquibacter oligotrophicus]MDH6179906.1 putative cell wall-binding protein [Antiquaquibacter oligotrophicus]UDF14334.1 cell wall-binding repeat-containing protein [Antiquaquibacter oligotrophicus]
MPTAIGPSIRRRSRSLTAAKVALTGLAVGALTLTMGVTAVHADLPPQTPGVTLRVYQMPDQVFPELCTLKSGQTPNVDKLMPTIDFTSDADFGASRKFISHTIANLTVPTSGQYTIRMTNDDGARLTLNNQLLLNNDGYQDSTSVEANITLDAGTYPLFVEHFEDDYGQRLLVQWRTPGSSSFVTIPNSALSTDADVVRVVAPGTKFCEGATDTPGDGLRLESVNPDYSLVNLRPEGFQPKVAALDFTDEGDLVVVTTGSVSAGGWVPNPAPGEVFLVEGATEADGPEDVTVTKIATGLKNPMGIDIIGDEIYVSERHQLTKLTDPDDDGQFDVHTKFAEWPDGGNFHEFAFGLIHDDENFYLNLSVAIDNGGATTNPQPAQNRGTSLAVSRTTGEVSYVAGGLRTPNGIAFGPDGERFAMDNQGGWLPASKLVHIEQGKFFNHYMNPAGPFDSNPVSAPALWIPQNEIGNSPSTPILLDQGVYAGQMLFGDVTYGGLQRAYLEKIDDEYQGAVFRHTAGLEVGVNRVIVGPDGALYIGGTGEGGNWGENGKLNYGLQKLDPAGQNAFDIKEMRVIEGGFELEYTEPISEETAANAANAYRVNHWKYVPTPSYGGPKVGEETLSVTDAVVSEDRTTVTLSVEGLKPGYVVHVRSPRPFESESGKELWSTEAWYTLNSLPGYVAPADRGWYEAEEAALTGSAGIATEHSGYSGLGFVAGIQNVGAGVNFTVTVPEAGTYPVNLRYANGPNPFDGSKKISLYVNDQKVGPWNLPRLGDWKTWDTISRDVALNAGTNTISLRYDSGDDGNVNFDVLSIGEPDICTPAAQEDGFQPLFDGTLESFEKWRLAGPGSFARQDDCTLRTFGGLGLLWYTAEEFNSYRLQLDWKLVADHNGGIFVGFPNPGNDPWVAVNQGYEIQIDATDADDRTTGAIYTFQGADLEARDAALNPVGQWNTYDIVVHDNTIKIYLNGALVNDFTSTDPARDLAQGFIGLQNHGSGETVYYRDVSIKKLADPEVTVTTTLDPATPNGDNGWWTTDVSVTATGASNIPGTVQLESKVGTGEYAPHTAPIVVSTDGTTEVAFTATDSEGNESEEIVETIQRDTVAPTVSASLSGRQVVLTASDATSGVASVEYRLSGDAEDEWTEYDFGFLVGAGAETVTYRATDNAGLVSEEQVLEIDAVIPGETVVDRIAGPDRYSVATTISAQSYPEGADVVFITNGQNYPDALSAGPAAAFSGGPLLLVSPTLVPTVVADELERLSPSHIVVVGGPASVSEAVYAQLEGLPGTIERIAGTDRYEASRALASAVFGESGATTAYIATGRNFPDALTGGAVAGANDSPVILVNGTATDLDTATANLLEDLGVTSIKVLGGVNSVSPGLFDDLSQIANTVRLAGADRYQAARAINADAYDTAERVFLTTGLNFPDALAGSAWAASIGAPMYVVPGTCVPQGVLDDIEALGATHITLLGGPVSLSEGVASLTACG